MDTQYFTLPASVHGSLRCTLCQRYLSCGPITRQKDTQKIICGRCPLPADGISEFLYEQVMAKFVFPCSYDDKGCTTKLSFNNVNEHELNCKFRTIQCPICLQFLSQESIKQHFHSQHFDLIMENGSALKLLKENLESYIMITESSAVAIFGYSYDWNENILKVKAGYISKNDNEMVNYKVQLLKPNGLSADLFYDQCNVYVYPNDQVVDILLKNYLFDCTDDFNICIQMTTKGDKKSKFPLAVLPVSKFMDDDDEIEAKAIYLTSKLNDIICATCNDIIIPPIYQVLNNNGYADNNNVYCETCISRESSCVKITKPIYRYPCRWKGCSAICTNKTIKEHVQGCTFMTRVCLFCKPESDFLITKDNTLDHLQEHAVYCPNHNIGIDLFNLNNTTETKFYFTIFEDKIIYFTCRLLSERKWSFNCQSQKGIKFRVSFGHDHCRLRANLSHSCKNEFTIEPKDLKFPSCFSPYNRLRIILNVESCA